ncbi:MAG: DUF4252 domain-containing protein [Bacteroides sp.]|nr:DUF4252 domain-containing protein [Bacteroides sp.]
MKRTYTLILFTLVFNLFAQAQQSFFDKYAEMEGVSSVYISKSMLSLLPDMNGSINGVYIGSIANRLENIQILSCDEPTTINKLRKETAHINAQNGYEELMRVREDGEKTTIYFKDSKGKKKEFILLTDEKDEFTIISITGDLTLQEIQGILKQ